MTSLIGAAVVSTAPGLRGTTGRIAEAGAPPVVGSPSGSRSVTRQPSVGRSEAFPPTGPSDTVIVRARRSYLAMAAIMSRGCWALRMIRVIVGREPAGACVSWTTSARSGPISRPAEPPAG